MAFRSWADTVYTGTSGGAVLSERKGHCHRRRHGHGIKWDDNGGMTMINLEMTEKMTHVKNSMNNMAKGILRPISAQI